MKSADDLKQLLQNIDSYPAYKGTKGVYRFGKYALGIDHVQGDPFAAPSSLHIEVSGKVAAFPEYLYDEKWKQIALEDYLIRQFGAAIGKYSFQAKGSGKSGIISVTRCGQEILKRQMETLACDLRLDFRQMEEPSMQESFQKFYSIISRSAWRVVFSMQDKIRKKWNVSWSYP